MSLRNLFDEEVRQLRASDAEYQAAELELAVVAAIREDMATKGITQAQLANKLGVTRAYVSRLLNEDGCNLTLRTLAKLAAALGAKVEWDYSRLLDTEWSCSSKPKKKSLNTRSKYREDLNALPLAA